MQEFNRLKSFRVGAGLTQEQMADALGMTRPTYIKKESDLLNWKLSEMQLFVEVINNATGSNYELKDIFY